MALSRRDLLFTALGLAGGAAGTGLFHAFWPLHDLNHRIAASSNHALHAVAEVPSAQEALQRLVDGNKRFVDNHLQHPHCQNHWRESLAQEQHPFAIVLGCSDSRVPPEIIFDEGLGDLFVIRQAGHVADDDTIGSIEYAAEHLHVPLVVVLGHESCGAVTAALGAVLHDEPIEGHVLRIVDDISPAIHEVREVQQNQLDAAIRANVRAVVRKLTESGPVLRSLIRKQKLRVVGSYYNLHSGAVEWLTI